jgi:hypothetical protein
MGINRHITVNIPSGKAISVGFQLGTGNFVGILMPDHFTGNTMPFEIIRQKEEATVPYYDSFCK